MGDVKLNYGNRLRLDVRYPGKPARGLPEPAAEIPVHYMDARLFVACRKPGAGMRLKTRLAEKVTCPAHLLPVDPGFRHAELPKIAHADKICRIARTQQPYRQLVVVHRMHTGRVQDIE
jgi:hypothetical protein